MRVQLDVLSRRNNRGTEVPNIEQCKCQQLKVELKRDNNNYIEYFSRVNIHITTDLLNVYLVMLNCDSG